MSEPLVVSIPINNRDLTIIHAALKDYNKLVMNIAKKSHSGLGLEQFEELSEYTRNMINNFSVLVEKYPYTPKPAIES